MSDPRAEHFGGHQVACPGPRRQHQIDAQSEVRFTGRPTLVVDVLSFHRGDDLVWKAGKYAAAGLPHCWVVDPRDELFRAYALEDGLFLPRTVLERGDPPTEVDLGVAAVTVDVAALLG